jgi:hypothetical protein
MYYAVTQNSVATAVIGKLGALSEAFSDVKELAKRMQGVVPADLQGIGFTPTDAASILSAVADANALAQYYDTGLPPSSYPQPPAAYVYGQSQRVVLGP